MARKANPVLGKQWRQRLKRHRGSELPIAAFCRREGVSQAAFYAWKRRLRGSTSTRHPPRRPKRRRAATQRQASQNVTSTAPTPLRTAEFLQLPVRSVPSSPWIELTLADGTLVRLPQENLAALATLLKVLRGDHLAVPIGEEGHA
jgi:hypothetical protein